MLYDTKGGASSPASIMTELLTTNMGGRQVIVGETGNDSGTTVNGLQDLYKVLDIPKEERRPEDTDIKVGAFIPARVCTKHLFG